MQYLRPKAQIVFANRGQGDVFGGGGVYRPAGDVAGAQAQGARQLPQGLAAHAQAQAAGLQGVELVFTQCGGIVLPQMHAVDAGHVLRVAHGGLPMVVDDEQGAQLVRGLRAADDLRINHFGRGLLDAQLHQLDAQLHAANGPVGIAHDGIEPVAVLRLQQGGGHGGKSMCARRAQQREVAALPACCHGWRNGCWGDDIIQRSKYGGSGMQANFCTAKTGRGGALAVLLQQIAAVGLPAGRLPCCCLLCCLCRQLCCGMQRRIQPAAGLLRHHADARLFVQLAGVGQHHVLLLRQGGA